MPPKLIDTWTSCRLNFFSAIFALPSQTLRLKSLSRQSREISPRVQMSYIHVVKLCRVGHSASKVRIFEAAESQFKTCQKYSLDTPDPRRHAYAASRRAHGRSRT